MHNTVRLLLNIPSLLLIISLALSSSIANAEQTYTVKEPAYVIKTTLDKITTFSTNSDKIDPATLRKFIEKEVIPH